MLLSKLLEGTGYLPSFDCDITGVTNDSRKAAPGVAFVCIRGRVTDGHRYAASAVEKGASAIICEEDLGLENQLIVADSHAVYGKMAANFHGNPAKKMHLVGVTGTKGKTTVTNLIKTVLTLSGEKVGLIGTVQNEIGDEILESKNSTPEAMELQELYKKMADAGCGWCIMEVSSHALDQHRIGDSHYDTAVFTNLTHEHLDYHSDMEDYFLAKAKLFDVCDTAVIGSGDSYGKRLTGMVKVPFLTFDPEGEADLTAKDIVCHADSVDFTLCMKGEEFPLHFNMPGLFSVKNALAAAGACLQLGIQPEMIVKGLCSVQGVRGRIEIIPTGRDFTVITDYAHTPDSIENVLSALRSTVKGRLTVLFGCGGDRDRTKRPLMAAAAARHADHLIVTSDNPRTEDPEAIIAEILPGLEGSTVSHETIVNRREAIFHAVKTAKTGDTVVLVGKGHEDYQIIGTEKFHFDEREVVAEALKELN